MAITLSLPAEVESRLRQRAARERRDIAEVACDLLERGLAERPSLDNILSPFRVEVAAAENSDHDLDQLIEECRQEVWQGKHGEAP